MSQDAIRRAIDEFDGSPTRLAAAIGGAVRRQHVEHWLKSGRVPAEYCPPIERATDGRVRCEDLRPDVEWGVLRLPVGEHMPAFSDLAPAVQHALEGGR